VSASHTGRQLRLKINYSSFRDKSGSIQDTGHKGPIPNPSHSRMVGKPSMQRLLLTLSLMNRLMQRLV